MTYAIIAHKATRNPRVIADGIEDPKKAIARASEIYEVCKLLASCDRLIASGVAIVVATTEDAAAMMEDGQVHLLSACVRERGERVIFQCGPY